MSSYGTLARTVARKLESYPFIRDSLKFFVHRINYLLNRKHGFTYTLNGDLQLEQVDHNTRSLFFGYYDKSPWSPDLSKIVYHSINGDKVHLLLFENGKYIDKVAETDAWNYQQGSMTTWLDNNTIVYNDRVNNELVSYVLTLSTKEKRKLPYPVQCVHAPSNTALSLNYKRLEWLRPDYGYEGDVTNFKRDQDYKTDGVWKMDLASGEVELIIDIDRLMKIQPTPEMIDSHNKVNHFMFSPDGKKFIFMHRWLGSKGKYSRLYVSDNSGKTLEILLDCRMISHYSWKNDDEIIAYARTEEEGDKYYSIKVGSKEVTLIGKGVLEKYGDGHPTYSPDGTWIVTDSYPDKARIRHLILYNTDSEKFYEIGSFFAPWKYNEEKRVDLHPRWSADGNKLSIDSAHDGFRKSYLIDVSKFIVENKA